MALFTRSPRRNSLPLHLVTLEDRAVPTVLLPDWTVGRYPFGWLSGEETGRFDLAVSASVSNSDGYLTGPQPGTRNDLARQNLREYAGYFGLTRDEVADQFVTITSGYADDDARGLQHVYLRQMVNGLPVLNSSIGVHYAADGRLSTINGGFFPGLAPLTTPAGVPTPAVSVTAAVVEASVQLGYDVVNAVPTVVTPATGADQTTVLTSPEASTAPITARLAYTFTSAGGTARPVWHFDLQTVDHQNDYDVGVDAQTGEVLYKVNWSTHLTFGGGSADSGSGFTAGGLLSAGGGQAGGGLPAADGLPTAVVGPGVGDTYHVYAQPVAEPGDPRTGGARTYEVNPRNLRYSPFGWHDTNGAPGPETTDTRGNNVSAALDLDEQNPVFSTPTANGNRYDGGPGLLFDPPLDLSKAPDTYRGAALTQLFYTNNWLHDTQAVYGFTEAAGNFQQTNYGGAGQGNDAVDADAQDGSLLNPPNLNNANFFTPPDGSPGRMQMFLFDITSPKRDGDLDNAVMFHEFGHGVSNRLTGGPADAGALSTLQSRGMGEGWSDFYSFMFSQMPADTKAGSYPLGNYLIGANLTTGPGIRRHPYSYNLAIDPINYGDYNTDLSGNPGQPNTPEVHNTGEIWASTLTDLDWLLIDKYGFDADLTTGYVAGGGAAGAGNKLLLQLVMDGLKNQPANPSFIDSRDNLLKADFLLTGGVNRREIWTAFARRGLGFGASTANSDAFGAGAVVTSNTLPATANKPGVIQVTPPGRSGTAPGSIALTFSEPMNPGSFALGTDVVSFTGPGGDLSGNLLGFSWSAGNTVLTITFTPPAANAGQGQYALTIGPDILAADDGSALDQNFDGTAGDNAAGKDRFTAYFGYDKTQLAVAGFTPDVGSVVSPDQGFLDVQFNEAVDPTSVSADDLQLSAKDGTVTGATVQPDGVTVRFTLAALPTGTLYAQIKQGAVADKFGFTNTTAYSTLTVRAVSSTTALPTPLAPLAPLGSLAYQTPTPVAGAFGGSDQDLAVYTLTVEAGQNLNVIVTPDAGGGAGLSPRVVVLAPDGSQVGAASAAGVGKPAGVYGVPVVAGTYKVQVSPAAGTLGTYTVQAQLNARPEAESLGGAANDTPATAQPLAGFVPAGGGAVTTVTGTSDAAGGFDHYSVSLAAGAVFTAGLRQTTGAATLALLDPSGVVVATSAGAAGGAGYTAVGRYTATATGTYFVRVQDTSANPYTLTVATDAVLDAEPNNSDATATPVGTAKAAMGGLLAAGDVDTYSFVAAKGNRIVLTTSTPGDAPGEPFDTSVPAVSVLDPTITLVYPDGTTVTDFNSAPDGRNATLLAGAPVGGTYLVRVSGAAGKGATGVYALSILNRTNAPPVGVSAGGPYSVPEGQTQTFSAAATDPDGDPLTYTWDLNGDNIYGDATGPTPTVTWAQLANLGLDGGPTPTLYDVRVKVSDGAGSTTSAAGQLFAVNAPPTAQPVDTEVTEGTAGTLTITQYTDPSAADLAKGLHFAYDFNDDGSLDLGDGTYLGSGGATASLPASLFPDGGAGQHVAVRVYVIDRDGGRTSAVSTVRVANAPPTGFPANGGNVPEGGTATVSLTGVSDVSSADTTFGFKYSFDFNDDGVYEIVDAINPVRTTPDKYTVSVPPQYTADGPATRSVRIRVTDKDGGSSNYRTTFQVGNVSPTASLFSPAAVDEGSAGQVTFSGASDPSAADTAAGFRYAFDFDGNGQFDSFNVGGSTYATAATTPSVTVPAGLLPDGPGVLTVRGRIYDKDGGYTEYAAPLTVRNLAPTATFANGGAVTEGSAGSVSFSAPSDSAADLAAGLRYAFDFDNDGTFDLPPGTATSAAVPASFLADGPATRTVRGRVIDKDGDFSDYTTVITVNNGNPTAAGVTGTAVTIGSPSTLTVTGASDPSAVDRSGLTYSFDFDGDGGFEVIGSTSPTASRVLDVPPTRAARARVTDKDGGSVLLSAGVLVVSNAAPTAAFGPTGPVPEGGLATVRFSGASHPSPATTAAGFRYAFDLDGDGRFDLGDGTYAGSVTSTDALLPAALTANAGTRTVRGRVIEVNGLYTDYMAPLTVTNVAPTATPLTPAATGTGPGGLVVPGDPVTIGVTQATDPSAADRAGLRYSFDFQGDGTFDVTGSTAPTATFAYPAPGRFAAVVRVSDPKGGATDYTVPVTVGVPPPVVAPAKPTYYAVGSDTGGGLARLFDDFGTEVYAGRPFGDDFAGGVRVATGDYTGDGVPDLVAGTGPGGPTRVVVIDGKTGAAVLDVQPFEAGFGGGVYVAAGDTDGDGKAEVVVTPDQGGGPVVAVYAAGRGEVARFFGIEDVDFRGGARPAVADVDGDGTADLIVAAGFGGGPRVAGFRGASLTTGRPAHLFADFFVFEQSLRNGVYVAAGDLNGDGAAELVFGGGPGGGPRVLAVDGLGLTQGRQSVVADFFSGDVTGRDGVRVAVADLDLDKDADVLVGSAKPGADGFRVRGYKASDLTTGLSPERFLLDPFPGELGGVFVG